MSVYIVILHDVIDRTALIEQLKQTRETLDKLLLLLKSSRATNSWLTFTSPVKNIDRRANTQASRASKSNAESS